VSKIVADDDVRAVRRELIECSRTALMSALLALSSPISGS